MTLTFAHPSLIIAGLIACALVFGYLRMSAIKRRRNLARFASPEMTARLTANVSKTRRNIKDILFILAVFCCFLALARPQYGDDWIEVKQKGIDILIAVDTSRSMLARDITPNRLVRAKLAIKDFVSQLEGDRIGLMPFAGTSFLMCPLTTDYDAFLASLDAITPDTVPAGGTDLAGVITAADKILEGESNHKILILVTDGEDLGGTVLQAADKVAGTKMTIYTVGVGTAKGELIPDSEKRGAFIKDEQGNFVHSKLDETMLTKIAEKTGGLYVPLGNMGQGFTTIYQEKLKLVPKEEHHERMERRPIERFYWPLALALFLLSMEFLLSGRKPARSFGLPLIKTAGRRLFKRRKLLIVLLLLPGYLPQIANGSTGDDLYQAQSYKQAAEEYAKELSEKPASPRLYFNLGDALYKAGDYEKAIESYTKALETDDLNLQAQSYFNLGNARYQSGKASLGKDSQASMDLYRQAIENYEGSLKLNPEDPDAVFNRDLVKKQLEELEKQQQQKQDQQDQQDKKDDKKDKDKDKQQQKDEQNKSGQDSEQKDNQKQEENGKDKSQDQGKQSENKQSQEDKQQENGSGKDKEDQKKQENQKGQDNGKKEDKADGKDKQQSQSQGKQDGQQADEPKEAQPGQAGDMSKADQERRQLGKMTVQEAQDMLDALEGEEGRLNFIPQGTGNPNERHLKNW